MSSSSALSGSFTNIISLTSDDTSFLANAFIATENAVGILNAGENTPITVSEVTSGVDDTKGATFYAAAFTQSSGITTSADCLGSGSDSTIIVAPEFAPPTATASSCIKRGPTNYDASLTIGVTVGYLVP